jgi:hypothetical protein
MAADDAKVEKRRHNEPSRSEPPIRKRKMKKRMSSPGARTGQIGRSIRQTDDAKQDHNHPVTLEEFEREHMGIAAKE